MRIKAFYCFWKINFVIIFLSCIIELSFFSHGFAEKSNLSIDVKDSIVELKAEKIPLMDILKAISDRTGISMILDESMTESISIEFKVSVEECFERLLRNQNYAMIYGNGEKGLSEIYVISQGIKVRYGGRSDSSENSMLGNAKDWFKREFGEGKALLHLVSATPSSKSSDRAGIEISMMPGNSAFRKIGLEEGDAVGDVNGTPVNTVSESNDREGIEITMVPGHSPFQEIGLEKGDVVVDVNGTPVRTLEEFIQALQSASKERPNIRIDRRRSNGRIDPIYIDVK